MTVQGALIQQVKHVAKNKYAWPGGYPLMTILDDGECLCASCTLEALGRIVTAIVQQDRSGWRAIAVDVNWEDETLSCVHCLKSIESAYGN